MPADGTAGRLLLTRNVFCHNLWIEAGLSEARLPRKGQEEFTVKKLGFGWMRLPLTDPQDQKSIDMDIWTRRRMYGKN